MSPERCTCWAGLACDGPRHSFRRSDAHGAMIVRSGRDHRDAQPSHVATLATQPRDWRSSVDSRGQSTYRADASPLPTHEPTQGRTPAQPSLSALPRGSGPAASWVARRAARILTQAATASQGQPMTIPAPQRRDRRGTLNCTTRGGASRALDVRDAIHHGQATRADTPALTGRDRREARRAAHRARRAHQIGGTS